jgi:hypothetical protein
MGASCSRVVIDAIPDKEVMLEVVDRIVQLEEMLKKGHHLTKVQEKEKKELEKVAKAMKTVQTNSVNRVGSLVARERM